MSLRFSEEELAEKLKENPDLKVNSNVKQDKLHYFTSRSLASGSKETEQAFLDWILHEAKKAGWKRAHFRAARTKKGWVTPVSADGKGFPDVLLLKDKRLVVVEAKSESGKLSPSQYDWLEKFGRAKAEVFCWTPSDRETILEVLKGMI